MTELKVIYRLMPVNLRLLKDAHCLHIQRANTTHQSFAQVLLYVSVLFLHFLKYFVARFYFLLEFIYLAGEIIFEL